MLQGLPDLLRGNSNVRKVMVVMHPSMNGTRKHGVAHLSREQNVLRKDGKDTGELQQTT